LHRARAFGADELIELACNLAADGVGAEGHTRDGGGDEQYWSDRKQGVVGEGRAQAWCIVIPPVPECGPEYCQDFRRAHNSGR
jgi:hypothetical protein